MYLSGKKEEILQRGIDLTEFLRVCERWMKYGERNIIDNSLYDIKLEVSASVAWQITLNGRKLGPIALFHLAGIGTNLVTCACRALVFILNFSFAFRSSETTATRNPANRFYANISLFFIPGVYMAAQDTRLILVVIPGSAMRSSNTETKAVFRPIARFVGQNRAIEAIATQREESFPSLEKAASSQSRYLHVIRAIYEWGKLKYAGTDMQSSIWKVISVLFIKFKTVFAFVAKRDLILQIRTVTLLQYCIAIFLQADILLLLQYCSNISAMLLQYFCAVVWGIPPRCVPRVITIVPLGISPSVDQHRGLVTLASETFLRSRNILAKCDFEEFLLLGKPIACKKKTRKERQKESGCQEKRGSCPRHVFTAQFLYLAL
ncbi:hypothetical protein EAG_02286 [Camponotus floridanus]|uniref:Uncharacterized protein n=1 Tax=Camponotus floridanus TaxID=104421 RepID=E2AMX7_CAMFO|nr:hypothetical protein EAG_02286 [Camponotus floridanus]